VGQNLSSVATGMPSFCSSRRVSSILPFSSAILSVSATFCLTTLSNEALYASVMSCTRFRRNWTCSQAVQCSAPASVNVGCTKHNSVQHRLPTLAAQHSQIVD
jgi:hypothetical protein